ncbi:alanyl-tRNA editing protein [Nakamurella lactea]|uniref:alanyl-tRNA editing protein n=1 Tax=Nakamurella lactea TaxID=459515 RepID=UPI00041DE067|nr:alanyl-tRNA editing protein [Nakamurella lactea]
MSSVYLCHSEPDLYDFEAEVLEVRPGAVRLSRSALHPGGGGQVADLAGLEHAGGTAQIVGVRVEGDDVWHLLDDPGEPTGLTGTVRVRIDAEHRHRVAQLHTDSHILNALVFDAFDGALVSGAQINGDGTGRMDFDLPNVDNERLRSLEPAVNDIIGNGLTVRAQYVPVAEADTTPGLIRSLSVAPPPTPDGRLRVIEIAGVDRQACGGTHLRDTGESAGFRILKVENKGKHNRRVRFALDLPG